MHFFGCFDDEIAPHRISYTISNISHFIHLFKWQKITKSTYWAWADMQKCPWRPLCPTKVKEGQNLEQLLFQMAKITNSRSGTNAKVSMVTSSSVLPLRGQRPKKVKLQNVKILLMLKSKLKYLIPQHTGTNEKRSVGMGSFTRVIACV